MTVYYMYYYTPFHVFLSLSQKVNYYDIVCSPCDSMAFSLLFGSICLLLLLKLVLGRGAVTTVKQ